MKKVILGSMAFLAGVLAVAVLLAGTMANDWTIDGRIAAFWNLSQYGLMPAFYCFVAIAAAGLGVAVWGILEDRKK